WGQRLLHSRRASVTRASLSVVIPAFNEASRISGTLATLCNFLPSVVEDWELRVVDDGSGDDTAMVVADFARVHAAVVLQPEPHRGSGGAVRAGTLPARGGLRFLCDADLSMPPAELTRFLALAPDHADIVIGSREGAGARRVGEPGYRHRMGRIFNALVQNAA